MARVVRINKEISRIFGMQQIVTLWSVSQKIREILVKSLTEINTFFDQALSFANICSTHLFRDLHQEKSAKHWIFSCPEVWRKKSTPET